MEGRLELHGAWSYLFVTPASGLDVRVTVPAAGAITTTIGETPSTFTFQPIQDAWVDSVRALALAEAAGGRERRARAGRTVDVIYSLEHDPARYGMGPRCQIHYYQVGGGRGGRMDFFVQIDAATGAVVGTGP